MNHAGPGHPGTHPHPSGVAKHLENLRLLAVFHYVLGGLMAFFSLFALLYVFMGVLVFVVPDEFSHAHPPGPFNPEDFIGYFFVIIGSLGFLIGETLAILVIKAGRHLSRRKGHTFAFVMGCVECIFMPLGTVLGVFTLVVLTKEEVKMLFVEHGGPPPEAIGRGA